MSQETSPIQVRPVSASDQDAVLTLLKPYVEQKKLLPRTIDELDSLLQDGFVAVTADRLVGFATLEIYSQKLAEIRALVVAGDLQGQGVGRRLVEACLERARQEQIMEVMAISSAETFFRSCGFDFTLPDEKKAFFLQTSPRQ